MAEADPMVAALENIPDADLEDLYASIKNGARSPADAFGFGPEAFNAVERMALAFYRSKRIPKASVLYSFMIQMDSRHGSAWRGLGACAQAQKLYEIATSCYRQAVDCDPTDVISRVFLGECLSLIGRRDEGVKILEQVIAEGTEKASYKPYITRARAIISAKGGMPARIVLMKEGKKAIEDSQSAATNAFHATSYKGFAGQINEDPENAKMLKELKQLVADGKITYAQVGRFSDKQLDGTYACAAKYAQMGRVSEAMLIAGWLAFIDPYKARYYQMIGICYQRMKQYEMANKHYRLAQALDENDPYTLCYLGETYVMIGEVPQGIVELKKAVKAAGNKKEYQEVLHRSQAMLGRFSR